MNAASGMSTIVLPFYHHGSLYFGNLWNDALRVRTPYASWQMATSPEMLKAFNQECVSRLGSLAQ